MNDQRNDTLKIKFYNSEKLSLIVMMNTLIMYAYYECDHRAAV